MNASTLRVLGAAALLMLLLMAKGCLLTLPAEQSAGQGEFDTSRAMQRLERILAGEQPHPVDSSANDMVRERLMAELRALGLDPQLTDDFTCNGFSRGRSVSCARVRNVLATMGPLQEDGHVLLVSHYDSTSAGPGAADDGIGVATMLEVAAALRGSDLAHPVTFLFNEGEEAGLIGARAFLQNHPLAARIDSIVNLEARGVDGPALMFETSRPNGRAIDAFAGSAPQPVASSLMTDFYKLLPNSTDVAVFEERPYTILNFAIGGNETRYHSPGDDLAALDRRSLQHMGRQTLASVQRLASGVPDSDRQYAFMDLVGRTLVVLPLSLSLVLLVGLLLLFGWFGWQRRSGLAGAVAAMLGAVLVSTGLAWVGQWAMDMVRSGAWWRGYPDVTSAAVYAGTLIACAAAILLLLRRDVRTLRAAYWLLFLLVGGALSLAAPGGSILFLFPPLIAAGGIILERWLPRAERVGAALALLALFLIFGPLLHLLEMFLGHAAAWIYAPAAALILLPFLVELRPGLEEARPRAVLGALAALLAAAWIAVAIAPAYSEERQQQFGIEYLWDADARRGRWLIANDGAPLPSAFDRFGPWEGRVEVPYSGRRRWAAAAPAMAVPAPRLEAVVQARAGPGRHVRFRLASGGADAILIRIPAEARVVGAGAEGLIRAGGESEGEEPFYLRCTGRACDGRYFTIAFGTRASAELTLIGIRNALPPPGAPLQQALPPLAQPQYGTDATIVLDRLRL